MNQRDQSIYDLLQGPLPKTTFNLFLEKAIFVYEWKNNGEKINNPKFYVTHQDNQVFFYLFFNIS